MKKLGLVTFGAVVLLSAGVLLGYQLRIWLPEQNVGERLREECSSIIEAAGGPKVSKYAVLRVLKENSEIAAELRSKNVPSYNEIDVLEQHPAWNDGIQEALRRERINMIENCVLKRGLGTR